MYYETISCSFLVVSDQVVGGLLGLCLALLHASAQTPPATQWNIVWNDEFNQPDGSSPDPTKWGYDTGAWPYNNELEYYTSRTNNARIEGGNLVIEADQESYSGRSYTSARLKTQGPMVVGLRPHGGAHQNPARTGNLARFLDAGHKH